jgi:hypothetical protein
MLSNMGSKPALFPGDDIDKRHAKNKAHSLTI